MTSSSPKTAGTSSTVFQDAEMDFVERECVYFIKMKTLGGVNPDDTVGRGHLWAFDRQERSISEVRSSVTTVAQEGLQTPRQVLQLTVSMKAGKRRNSPHMDLIRVKLWI